MKWLFLVFALSANATIQPEVRVLGDSLVFPPQGGVYAITDLAIGTNIVWVNYRLIYTPDIYDHSSKFVTNSGHVSLQSVKVIRRQDLPPMTQWSILKECGTNLFGTCPRLPGNSGYVAVERYDIIR